MTECLGPEEAGALCHALTATPAPTSIRINPRKLSSAPFDEGLLRPVPWCTGGFYLKERPTFTLDPRLHAGAYYVQEASSMFLEQAWRTIVAHGGGRPRRVLDLCAAPGGKSTLWRSLIPDDALLVANEPIRQRAQILAENLTKWGHPATVVTSAYPEEFAPFEGFFDIIGADVPCSGEGMFRKDETARSEWSPEAVERCAERQWQIVSDIWPALRPGGWMVYSTCTFNRREDEEMATRICRELGATMVEIPVMPEWGTAGHCHFYPHRAEGEGFFLTLLRKDGGEDWESDGGTYTAKKGRKGKENRMPAVKNAAQVVKWLNDSDTYRIFRPSEQHIAAIHKIFADDAARLSSRLRVLTAGVLLAEEKGSKLIPQHALALSDALAEDAFPRAELPLADALAYLRRESITLSSDVPRGYVIVTFDALPLGFVNNLGARANNLYPDAWKIRIQVPRQA